MSERLSPHPDNREVALIDREAVRAEIFAAENQHDALDASRDLFMDAHGIAADSLQNMTANDRVQLYTDYLKWSEDMLNGFLEFEINTAHVDVLLAHTIEGRAHTEVFAVERGDVSAMLRAYVEPSFRFGGV